MSSTRGPGFWWRLIEVLILPLFNTFVTLTVTKDSSLPRTGPFIVAPNHHSEIDPIVMGVAVWRLGRTPRFLAKASLFKIPVVGFLLRATGQIPVERGASSTGGALRAANQLISQDQGLIVYPEGTLTRQPDLWPMKGKTGAIRMALESGIPLYPAAHWGTQDLMARYGKSLSVIPRPRITVVVGEAMNLEAFQGRPITRELLDEATDALMHAIQDLVASLRGEAPPETIYQPQGTEPGRSR